jgi:hypothetical protein
VWWVGAWRADGQLRKWKEHGAMACEWRGSEKVGLRSTTQWLAGSVEWPASFEGCNTRGKLAPFYGSTTLLLLRDCDFNSVSPPPPLALSLLCCFCLTASSMGVGLGKDWGVGRETRWILYKLVGKEGFLVQPRQIPGTAAREGCTPSQVLTTLLVGW